MAETCYSRGKKVILVPGQKDNGTWVCQFTIPELKESEIGKYQGHPPGAYKTEQEAKMAAFEYAKKFLDSSYIGTPCSSSHKRPRDEAFTPEPKYQVREER